MKRLARTDLAIQSRQIFHQAVWCGVVFGLMAVLTVLNLLPPVEIEYMVSGKVLASPERATTLHKSMTGEPDLLDSGPSLRAVKTLDESSGSSTTNAAATSLLAHDPNVVLLGLNSLWQTRCNHSEFQSWIDGLSASKEALRSSSNQELLTARWELEAAKHYQAQHEFLAASTPALPQEPADKNVFQLASTRSDRPASETTTNDDREFASKLQANVSQLESQLTALTRQSAQQTQMRSGRIEITDGPFVKPQSKRIPAWMALSVLVLGIAAGASAGWLQLRLQSGGVYDPSDVAQQLAKLGLPEVATVEMQPDRLDSSDWLAIASETAGTAGRKGGRNLIRISEWVVAFWCLAILARLAFDPLWRGLLLDSPLAALGRLLTGMP